MQQAFSYFWWFPHIPSGTNSLNFTVNLRGILKLGEQERCQNSYLNMKILVNSQKSLTELFKQHEEFSCLNISGIICHQSSSIIYCLFWPAYYSSYEMTTRTDVITDKILLLLLSWHQIFTYLFTCFAYGLTFVRCVWVFVSFFTYLAASFEFQKLCYFILGPICNTFVALFHWNIYESAIKSFKIELNLT